MLAEHIRKLSEADEAIHCRSDINPTSVTETAEGDHSLFGNAITLSVAYSLI